jgi:signal transduction histidine kinase
MRSVITVPIFVDGEALGYLGLYSVHVNFYNESHARVAALLAERAAQAVRNARMYAVEQERARAAEGLAQLRSDFVSAVSHELRTPLTSIIGYTELLQARWHHFSEPERLERLGHIARSAARQQRLVEDLLLLSRLDADKFALTLESVTLVSVINAAVDEVQGSYPGQRIILQGPGHQQVMAAALRTMQVLANLLDNAAKYSPEGSPITVNWVVEDQMVALRVIDRGSGVPEEGRDQLFSRFGRLTGSRIRAGRVGTGLGLYLSRRLAVAMGGDIDLEATGPTGSTFRLRLPIAAA